MTLEELTKQVEDLQKELAMERKKDFGPKQLHHEVRGASKESSTWCTCT